MSEFAPPYGGVFEAGEDGGHTPKIATRSLHDNVFRGIRQEKVVYRMKRFILLRRLSSIRWSVFVLLRQLFEPWKVVQRSVSRIGHHNAY